MSGIRRAAAALYGLHREDREAILAQLATHEQEALGAALAELDSLGFAATIDAMLRAEEAAGAQSGVSRAASNAGGPAEEAIEHVRRASQEQVQIVLANEPESLVAEVLQLEAWSWADPFLAHLSPPRRSGILARQFPAAALPPARRAWLVDTLAQRIATLPVNETVFVSERPTHRLADWFPWRT